MFSGYLEGADWGCRATVVCRQQNRGRLSLLLAALAVLALGGCAVHHVKSKPAVVRARQAQARPLPPPGVYQVGDHFLLVHPGYEANMHPLCDSANTDGDKLTELEVLPNGWWKVVCGGSLGTHFRNRPPVTRAQR